MRVTHAACRTCHIPRLSRPLLMGMLTLLPNMDALQCAAGRASGQGHTTQRATMQPCCSSQAGKPQREHMLLALLHTNISKCFRTDKRATTNSPILCQPHAPTGHLLHGTVITTAHLACHQGPHQCAPRVPHGPAAIQRTVFVAIIETTN
jgi:hypothetical protein